MRMGKTNHCSLDEDEKLAQQVKKYPCLFDKNDADYKNKISKQNAWSKIDKARERQPGTSLHEWEVLLNRYSRKRMKIKSCNVLGASSDELARAEKNLSKYKFMHWYNPYIRRKATRLNSIKPISLLNFSKPSVVLDDCSEALQLEENESEKSSSHSSQDRSSTSNTSHKQSSTTTETRQKQEEVFNEILSLLQFKKNETPQANDTADDIFGKLVSAELKTLPEEIRYVAKHEISEVLYRYRGMVLSTVHNKETILNTSTTSRAINQS